MATEPKVDTRPEQPCVGKRLVMPMDDFEDRIPALTAEIAEWLGARGTRPAGPPFVRYHVIDMPDRMDVEVGFPVDTRLSGDGEVAAGVRPAGRHAALTYTGVAHGIEANARLVDWIGQQGKEMASHKTPEGEAFEGRYETFLNAPEADPEKMETEVAILLRD